MSNNKQGSNKQYVATCKTSIQISEDRYKVINPSMLCDENTTIKEIELFFRANTTNEPTEIKIIELQTGKK
jgi:hypothetical protein